jgi:phytoene desaturase
MSKDVAGLWFCGAGPHPGAGLPGVMASGKIVADLIGDAPTGRRRVAADTGAAFAAR